MVLDSLWMILGVAFALGCDAFSVGLALGTRQLSSRAAFRLWFHFGLFQFLMPIIGWNVGNSFIELVKEFDHWLAFGVLAFVAVRMFIESLKVAEEAEETVKDPTRGWKLMGLSLATSLDALGIGFGMGVSGSQVVLPSVSIGLVAAGMTYGGIKLGGGLSSRFGKRVETVGAIILMGIAIKLLEV